jgi:hypothetical protein
LWNWRARVDSKGFDLAVALKPIAWRICMRVCANVDEFLRIALKFFSFLAVIAESVVPYWCYVGGMKPAVGKFGFGGIGR